MAIDPNQINIKNIIELIQSSSIEDNDLLVIGQGIYARKSTVLELYNKFGVPSILTSLNSLQFQINQLNNTVGNSVLYSPQVKTPQQKADARNNLDVYSRSETQTVVNSAIINLGNVVNSVTSVNPALVDNTDPKNPVIAEFREISDYNNDMLNKADIDGNLTTGGIWWQDQVLSDRFTNYKQVWTALSNNTIEWGNIELDKHIFLVDDINGVKIKVGGTEGTIWNTLNLTNVSQLNNDAGYLQSFDLDGFVYDVQYNSTNHQITFYQQNEPNIVIDLPIEQLITGVQLVGDDLVFTFEDGSTVTVPLNTLLVGVVKSVNGLTPNSQGEIVLQITDIPGLQSALNGKVNLSGNNATGDLLEAINWRHQHANKSVLDNLTQSVINNSHTHANKALLDTYNQTNANITDAVNKRHDAVTLGTNTNGLSLAGQVISLALATSLSAGAMSSTDKTKLDNIAPNANNYVLPTASATILGGVKVGSGLSIDANGVLSNNAQNVTQVLGISGNTVSLSGGGGSVTVPFTDWANIPNKPSTFPPSAHTHPTNQITVLTGYTIGTDTAISATDSLNAALGKIQAQINAKTNNVGTVTSITAGAGLSGGTITTSGIIALNSATIASLAKADTALQSVPDNYVTKNNISNNALSTTVIDFNNTGNGASILYAGAASTNTPLGVSGITGGLLIRGNHSTVGESQLYLARGEDDALLYRNQSGIWFRGASREWVISQNYATTGQLPTVGNGSLSISTPTGLNVSGSFTANQSGNSSFNIVYASGYQGYTTAESNKLAGIAANANNYVLPTASASILGGIKVGANLSIDANGVLSSNYINTTYSAGNGLTLAGTVFSLPVTQTGTGNAVTAVTQTANGITVTKGATFLTSFTETDPTVPAWVKAITQANINQWNLAEQNVNADWNATSGDAMILNKPTLQNLTAGNHIDITSNAISVQFNTNTYVNDKSGNPRLYFGDTTTTADMIFRLSQSNGQFSFRDLSNTTFGYLSSVTGWDLSVGNYSVGSQTGSAVQRNMGVPTGGWVRNLYNLTIDGNTVDSIGHFGNSTTLTYGYIGGISYNSKNAIRWGTNSNVGIGFTGTSQNFDYQLKVRTDDYVGTFIQRNSTNVSDGASIGFGNNHSTAGYFGDIGFGITNNDFHIRGNDAGVLMKINQSNKVPSFPQLPGVQTSTTGNLAYLNASNELWKSNLTIGDLVTNQSLNPILLNYVPIGRTITINGQTFDLSTNRTWTVSDTITRLRGTASGTYTSGDLTLLAGTNIGVVQSGSNFTINNLITDNAQLTNGAGYITSASLPTNYWTTNSVQTGLTGNKTTSGVITSTGGFVGALTGNASTATTLATARTINGTSFDGSANITTALWGNARNITIGNTTKSVNGSANVSWSLAEIGIVTPVPQNLFTSNNSVGNGSGGFIGIDNGQSTNITSLGRNILADFNDISQLNIGFYPILNGSSSIGFPTVNGQGFVSIRNVANNTGGNFSLWTNTQNTNELFVNISGTNGWFGWQKVITDGNITSYIPTVGNGNISYLGTGAITGGGVSTANQSNNTAFTFDLTAGTKSDIALGVTANGWGNHAGLYVPLGRTLTINGQTFDLSANRSWTIPDTDTVTRLRGTASGTFVSGDLTLLAGSNIAIAQSGTNFTISATNTTYTAGTGISIASNVITNSAPNVQADWNATSGLAQILNKPTIPTVGNGQLSITTGTGLNGSVNFLANQSGNSSINIDIASGYILPTNAQVTQWNNSISAANLALGTRTSTTMPITNSGGTGVTLPIATTALAGLMSGADKTKLDGISANANNYVHPNSGVSAGTYNQVTVNAQGHVTTGNNQPYQTNTQVNNAINNAIAPLIDEVTRHFIGGNTTIPIVTKKTIVTIATGVINVNLDINDAPYNGYELAINGCGEWSAILNGKLISKCNEDPPLLVTGASVLFWWNGDRWVQAI